MKKVLTMLLAMALVAAISVGATLAFLTDKDEAVNTFTSGKVDIKIIETMHDGSEYVDNQKLLPGSSTTTAVPKEVTVKVDEKSEESYVWVEILVPRELYLDNAGNETNNGLHFNQFKSYIFGMSGTTSTPNGQAALAKYPEDHQWSVAKYVDDTMIGDQNYAVLRTTHHDAVKPGDTTCPAMSQVYMDDSVYTNADGKYMIPTNTAGTEFAEYNGPWELVIRAYAIQAAGIPDVDTAVANFNSQDAIINK